MYKGQLTSLQVRHYFPDLTDKRLVSAFGLVHSRFATNTFPSWKLAQPFRYIAHNGEINTLQGNLNWLKTSEKGFTSPLFSQQEIEMLLPIVAGSQSDSACLDNMIELLTLSGRSLPHVMMMLIPEAWDHHERHGPGEKGLLRIPRRFSGTLGRPGLHFVHRWQHHRRHARPQRPAPRATASPTTTGSSWPPRRARCIVDPKVGERAWPPPTGQDVRRGFVERPHHQRRGAEAEICAQKPYGEWLNRHKIRLENLPNRAVTFSDLETAQVFKYQKAFGYSTEDLETIITPMALEGKEPIGSMGTDVPLAVLSDQPQHLSSYFKQLFAQVTNPPIDPIRERLVMSSATFVGNIGNYLVEDEMVCHTVALPHPILSNNELEKIRSIDTGIFQAKTLQMYFRADGKPGSLKKALGRICRYAEDAVDDGFEVLVLSDRAIDSEHAAIPSLLSTAAVHHHLIRKGLRGKVGIVVEAGDVWEVHHFASLAGLWRHRHQPLPRFFEHPRPETRMATCRLPPK